MVEEAAPGATFRIVHLAGGADQMKSILAGDVAVAFDNVGSIVKRVQSGEVKALAVLDHERSKFLPDVPTRSEERRVGTECVSTCRSRWSPNHYTKNKHTTNES